MCTHGRFVTNQYTHQQFWCKCGKCKACKQEKAAARSSRIRNEYDGKSAIYFCTLTYDRMSCPYFKEKDLQVLKDNEFGFLNIYRGHDIKWSVQKQKYIKTYAETLLEEVPVDFSNYDERSFYFKHLKHQYGKVGVCYFRDLQNFEKRFRIRLQRSGYDFKLKFFNVSEYGGKSLRPHFHFLLFAPPSYDEVLRTAFIESWPFGRRVRNAESFQLVQDDPAGYVSSYVNSANCVCEFLTDYFKSKHSASKYFGHGRNAFTLVSLTEKIERGCLDYSMSRNVEGVPTVLNLPIPKYVINRFFPLFKGYSRLGSSAVSDYLQSGFNGSKLSVLSKTYDARNVISKIDYSHEDIRKIGIRLFHAYESVKSLLEKDSDDIKFSVYDYAIMYEKAWRVYKSTCYKYFVLDSDINDFYKYDNICLLPRSRQLDLYNKLSHDTCKFIVSNNDKPHYVNKTAKMSSMFDKYCKQKDITNYVLTTIYDDL